MGIIRLILALSVVLSHLPWRFKMVGGQYAVEAFYIISGFYMSLILSEKYLKKPLKLFYSNRLLKLFPIYLTVLVSTIFISIVFGKITNDYSIGNLNLFFEYFPGMDLTAKIYIVFVNSFLVLQDTAMFMGIDWGHTNSLIFSTNFSETSSPHLFEFLLLPQAWTIGVEITFYLIAPILVRKLNNLTLVGLALSSLVLRYLLYTKFGLNHDPWTYRFFPTELVFFIMGILSYRIYKSELFSRNYLKVNSNFIKYSLLFVILGFQFLAQGFNMITKVGHEESRSIVAIIFFTLVFLLIPFLFESTKKNKLDNRISLLSYPVYISHILIVEFCSKFLSNNYLTFTSLLLTIGVSYLLEEVIQTRVDSYRQKRIVKG